MKTFFGFVSTAVLFVFLTLGCNGGCTTVTQQQKFGFQRFDGYSAETEATEQRLIKHIADRTVRISVMCKIVNEKGEIVKNYFPSGWGSGTIVMSTSKYSLIQTANHVMDNKNETQDNLTRICDKYTVERRDLNNRVVFTYSGRIDIVVADEINDISVFKVYANLGVSSAIAKSASIGQEIRILAYPGLRGLKGSHLSYSRGYIATLNIGKANSLRNADDQMRVATFGFFGSSGSGVWNIRGELVGVVTMLTGFNTFGGFVPQQDCIYGPSAKALRTFYTKNKLTDVLSE